MAISRNKKQPTAKKSRVKNATITDLADFDPETTIVIDGDANFADYPEITDLGNLQKITGDGNFENSQVLNLGNLQTIGWIADFQNSKIITLGNLQTIVGFADFRNSQVQDLGNLQTIEGDAYFSNSQVQSLGNLQTIGGYANFENSKIESLGNLQTIRRNAYFNYSKVQDLGNLQTIGGDAFFGGSQIQSLGELQTIGGGAYFWYSKFKSLGNLQTIGGDADFKNSKVKNLGNLQTIGRGANFFDSQVKDLGNLQTIGGDADFYESQVQNLGNLQTIRGSAFFEESQVQNLGNLQTIGGKADFGNRTDLEAEWKARQGEMNYAEGGGVGMPNAAWFVFQEKFPEAFEYYLKNNEYGVSKGDLMAMAYESTRGVDSAIPTELWKQVDNTMFYVYDYQNSSFGELVDLREKIKTSEVPVALSFVIDKHGYYGSHLPNELKNADFATALMYVYANRDVIDEFQIRPKRNLDNYAEGGGVKGSEKFQIRKNLLKKGVAVPVGDNYISEGVFEGRYLDEGTFEIKHNGEWKEADSVDWEKYAEGGGVGLPKYLVYYMDNDGRKRIVDSGLTYQQAVKKSQQLVSQGVSAEYGVEKKYAKGGGVGNFPPKGELKNKENLLLKYEKIGSDYEFFVYKPEKKDVSSYEQIKYVCVNKDCPTRMSYNQFLNYLYAETYLDDRKYANGGGVEIPKNKSLRHFILNEMSDGMIANRTPFSDYATIDKIRIQAVQILNRDGDREYSMQSVSDLIQEALLEYEENKNYADGGGVGLKREKEKLTNLAYQLQNADEGWIRNNHSKFVQMLNDYKNQFKKVYGHSNYENPNNYADGGGVGMPNVAWFVFQEKFPEAFEYYLKNNEYGVSKGDLMAMAYESTRGVDSAIPTGLWKQVDNTMFYVYDYQNSSFGELVDLREKIKTSEVPVALSFVIDRHGYYGDDLPNELKNADFATALMYVYANRDVIDEFQIRPKRNVDNYADGGGVGVKKYEIRDYNDIYEGRYDEQGLIDWAKEYAQSRKEIIYINSVEDAKMYIESPDKNGNQNFEIYEYAKGGGVGGKDFVVEIYSTNFENTLIAERTFKTEKAAIRYAYSVEDLNDDGFYFNIFGLDKNGKNLIKVFGLIEAEEDLIRQNPKYKNCISWKLDMGVHSYPNNKTIFSKTFSRLDKALELAISLENESLSATINNLHYTTFIYANGGGVGQFNIGQSVMIAENNDNENYDDFRGKELVIYHKATNEKEHRGFDNSMEGQALYSFFLRETGEQVPFSCYDYELEQY